MSEQYHVQKEIEQQQSFDARAFRGSADVARKTVEYWSKATVFTQRTLATSVLCTPNGGVKLIDVDEAGKEAVVAILGSGDFLGEGCLAGQPQQLLTAATITPSTILVIELPEMIRLLHSEPRLLRFLRSYAVSES